jgi:hypothetical protein
MTVLFPATGLLPQFGRLDRGHQDFERTRPVHFLAYDALYLMQDAYTERHPGKQPGGQAAYHTCAQHQLVADDLGFCRHLF